MNRTRPGVSPVAASAQAKNVDDLYSFFLAFSGIIFGIVVLVMLVAVYRFRANPGDHRDGSNLHGVTWLEVVWTAIPYVIVLAVAFVMRRARREKVCRDHTACTRHVLDNDVGARKVTARILGK